MKRSLFYLRFTFIFSITLLVVLSLYSYAQLRQQITYSTGVDRAHLALQRLEEVLFLVKDAEAGQRGFLVSHDPVYLEPYRESFKQIGRSFNALRELTSDSVQLQVRLDTLQSLISRRYALLNMGIINDTSRLGDPQNREPILRQGRFVMDSIRLLVAQTHTSRVKVLAQQSASRSDLERFTPTYTLVLFVVVLFFLSGSFLLINRELRQRVAAQQQLEQKIDALNRSNAELEQFAYVASHDLQEPLRKIRAFGSKLLLRFHNQLQPEGYELLEKIETSAIRMQTLIDDLLSFSRLVMPQDQRVSTDLNELVQDVINDLSESIQARNALVEFEPLPTLAIYPSQIRQLFQNLISNALKFSQSTTTPHVLIVYHQVGGSEVAQATGRRREEEYHQIDIIDNGIGFEVQYAEKIFVIFQRLHGPVDYEGTGIGLAICKRVVSNHQGFIEAHSKPGEGSTFTIYLPLIYGTNS